jgi:hypothetical protein
MIAIDLGDALPDIVAFADRYGISVPLAIQDQDQAKKAFGVLACPATVLIDRKGRIIGRSTGAGDWTSESARALVRSVLGIRQEDSAPAVVSAKRAHKSVHLVSAVMPNDTKLNEMLDEAADSLKTGDEVSILFDGQSIGALRVNAQKTLLESTGFTSQQRNSLAKRLGVSKSAAPRNQFEYIQQLAKTGAKVLVNANAIHALGLTDGEIHPIATRVSVDEMEKVVDESDACYTYQHE